MDSVSWEKPHSLVITSFHWKYPKATAEHQVTDYISGSAVHAVLWLWSRQLSWMSCSAYLKIRKKKKQKQQFKTYVNEISFIRTKIIYCYDYNSELKHSMEDRCIIDSDDLHSRDTFQAKQLVYSYWWYVIELFITAWMKEIIFAVGNYSNTVTM